MMPPCFFAESDAFPSASAKPEFVGGTPPVYLIITVTVTTQLSLHKVSFIIHLVSSYHLLTQLCWRVWKARVRWENEGVLPICKKKISRSHTFYDDPGCTSVECSPHSFAVVQLAFVVQLFMHPCLTTHMFIYMPSGNTSNFTVTQWCLCIIYSS